VVKQPVIYKINKVRHQLFRSNKLFPSHHKLYHGNYYIACN